MSISMIGIDHKKAPLDIRAQFSFTKKNCQEALEKIKEKKGILGCVLLSTCNRMELYVSQDEDENVDLYAILCDVKGMTECNRELEESYFIKRRGKIAVEHLFYLTAGLKSQILGEDQILTQVKDALSAARTCFASDSVLEVLFRMAVTAGKKIKTEVPFAHANPSVIHQALQFLEKKGYSVKNKTCMVIGNGEMGKVAAQTLREYGADVTVTVRQYRSGEVQIPTGCKRINYGERMQYLPSCDLIVSATASPNFTLREELFEQIELQKDLMLIDLAVPRDIEPVLAKRPQITLYDCDSFKTDETSEEYLRSMKEAGEIVLEQMEEFDKWYTGREIIPRIMHIKADAVEDFHARVDKIVKNSGLEEEQQGNLQESMDLAAGKVINKIMFGLKEFLKEETFMECVAGLEKLYEE